MSNLIRRSLLVQLLGVYLLFVLVAVGAGFVVSQQVQERLQAEVQASDLALAQTIALETDTKIRNERDSLAELAKLQVLEHGESAEIESAFRAFKSARSDIDRVYLLDATGILTVSVPSDVRTLGIDYSDERVFRKAQKANGPVIEAGVVDLTTFNAVVAIAHPLRDSSGRFVGVVATNLLLEDLSAPLRAVVEGRARQSPSQRLVISLVDDRGQLIATPHRARLLQKVVDDLPGAAQALAGKSATQLAAGPQDEEWLYSAMPIPSVGWAVVVQRPAADALALANYLNSALQVAVVLFGLAGLLFWLVLASRVIQPLHWLATRYATLRDAGPAAQQTADALTYRQDEVGGLARSLQTLERDVSNRLAELHTLLETSNAVIDTLDPHTVAGSIIQQVKRLVDVQAAAVFVPDQDGVLRVLASTGRSSRYDQAASIPVDSENSPSAQALRERKTIQLIAGRDRYFPAMAYEAGFRTVLAIPIVSKRVGGVVLIVQRVRAEPFTPNEIDLLLTFANHATLAWEHAVLYERSDERLQQVAQENERLYQHAKQEHQTLAAIMGSMSDGLILRSLEGQILYANRGAGEILGIPTAALTQMGIEEVNAALRALTNRPDEYVGLSSPDRIVTRAESGGANPAEPGAGPVTAGPERGEVGEEYKGLIEIERNGQARAIRLRFFDVRDGQQAIGRGLLLRDVTREREIDQFKTTLLGAVGHELRTPLAAIKGYTSTLLQKDVTWSMEDEEDFLMRISEESDRMAQLVNNLLDLSRLEAGLLELDLQPWRVEDLIPNAAQRLDPHDRRLVFDLAPNLPIVQADRARIEVVIHNLLANALAYGEGSVIVSARQQNGRVDISVSDEGPGVANEELPHLFERFYRAQRGIQTRSGGTGLGLAICKSFVEAHGNTIRATNGPRGFTVSFSLSVAVT